jgi:hypothetical protein
MNNYVWHRHLQIRAPVRDLKLLIFFAAANLKDKLAFSSQIYKGLKNKSMEC